MTVMIDSIQKLITQSNIGINNISYLFSNSIILWISTISLFANLQI